MQINIHWFTVMTFFPPGEKSGRALLRCTPAALPIRIQHIFFPPSKGTVSSGNTSQTKLYCTKSNCTA